MYPRGGLYSQYIRRSCRKLTDCDAQRFITLNRNGTASINRMNSRLFDPYNIYDELKSASLPPPCLALSADFLLDTRTALAPSRLKSASSSTCRMYESSLWAFFLPYHPYLSIRRRTCFFTHHSFESQDLNMARIGDRQPPRFDLPPLKAKRLLFLLSIARTKLTSPSPSRDPPPSRHKRAMTL